MHNTLTRKKARFEAMAGQHVRFRAANVSGKGFSFLVLFMGVAPMFTVLEREDDGGEPPAG